MTPDSFPLSDAPDRWRGRRVLVTGGAGFIGSALCLRLAALGADVTAVDSFLPGGGAHPLNLDGADVRLVRADLREAPLEPLCEGAEAVFNLAGQTGHMTAQRDPHLDLAINAAAQLRLIEALRAAAPEAVVAHASTRQVYGRQPRLPVSEAAAPAPPDFNAVSKLAGEHYWLLEHRLHGRAVAVLRLTNCFGPRLRIRSGWQSVLGRWIGQALRGETLEVWGGSQLRDFTYVDDAVEALLRAAATPAVHGRPVNVGGPEPRPVLAIAETLSALSGVQVEVKPFPAAYAAIDIGAFQADDALFRDATGWAPRVGLEEGLERTLAWFRPRLSAYLSDGPEAAA